MGNDAAPRRSRMYLWLGVGTLLLAGAASAWLFHHSRQHIPVNRHLPEDPRLTYSGPFQNVHPDVKYVGSKRCADCHLDKAETYARHPMARTLIPIAEMARSQVYDKDHNNPFQALDSLLTVVRDGDRVRHRVSGPEDSAEDRDLRLDFDVHYAIGSGSHGHSYLTSRDGYMVQTPISWFSQKQKWDLSPNFTHDQLVGRPIIGVCLFCHSDQARPVDYTINRNEQPIFPRGHGIGCERCHGPGEKHAGNPGHFIPIRANAKMTPDNRMDPTIVNPKAAKKLSPELCESICQQCHIGGEARVLPRGRGLYDYRPGLPLDSAWSIFVYAQKDKGKWKAVNHVEQMYLSKCFQKSGEGDRLGCISCHDSHRHIEPAERVGFYRQRCLTCHSEGDMKNHAPKCAESLPRRQAEKNSCVDCHMKRYVASDIVHNASTDHRILRQPAPGSGSPDEARDLVLTHFHKGQVDPNDKELSRDYALALVDKEYYLNERTMELLDAALKNDPDDIPVWERKALVFMKRLHHQQALATFEMILGKAPEHERALANAAAITQAAGQWDKAIDYGRRARAVNPWMPDYARRLATAFASKGDWPEASRECQKWLELDPRNVDARKLHIDCLLHEGKTAEARAAFARIEALRPPNIDSVRAWFQDKQK